jgi:ADP-ribosylation factor GTPase-activating protein 1
VVGQGLQTGVATAGTTFNRLVEGSDGTATSSRSRAEPEKKDFWDSFGAPPSGPASDKKDFWDEFSSAGGAGAAAAKKPSGIGTSAMKKPAAKKDEDWGEW